MPVLTQLLQTSRTKDEHLLAGNGGRNVSAWADLRDEPSSRTKRAERGCLNDRSKRSRVPERLAEYAYAHSTESGAVPDNVLDLPTWYARYPGVSGVISAGKSYAFFGSPPPGLVSEMINLTGGSLAIGTALAGSLVTPSSGNLGVTLPATVPNGAAVAYQ